MGKKANNIHLNYKGGQGGGFRVKGTPFKEQADDRFR